MSREHPAIRTARKRSNLRRRRARQKQYERCACGKPNCDCAGGIHSYLAFYHRLLAAIRPASVVEWGPGPNTEAALATGAAVTTIEHNRRWLPRTRHPRLTVHHRPLRHRQYERLDGTQCQADVYFVDGRRRAECLREIHRRCKSGAIAVVHDAQRRRYHNALCLFRHVRFYGRGVAVASKEPLPPEIEEITLSTQPEPKAPAKSAKKSDKTPLYDPEPYMDRSVHVETFTGHIRRGEPFCHLRYGDGEWLSILGKRGNNCDKHNYYPDTMGRELGNSLREVADLHPENRNIYCGQHMTWHQSSIQQWVLDAGILDRIRWIGNIELQCGLASLATLELFRAVAHLPLRSDAPAPMSAVLVANKHLNPIAAALKARHVVIPRRNCYAEIDRIERECREHMAQGPTVVMASASMAAECLLWRLWKWQPDRHFLLDTGHIFDAIVNRPSRRYTRNNKDGVMDVIREHYRPFFGLEG